MNWTRSFTQQWGYALGELFTLDPLYKKLVLPKPRDQLSPLDWANIRSAEAQKRLRITWKRDGYSTSVAVTGNRISVYSRQNNEWTGKFVHVERDLREMQIPHDTLLCGESTVASGGHDDPILFGRFTKSSLHNSLKLQKQHPSVHLSFFDVMRFKGRDVAGLPYDDRLDILQHLCKPRVEHVYVVEHLDMPLALAQERARTHKWEGLVLRDGRAGTALRLDGRWDEPLRPDGCWKWKVTPTDDFVALRWIPSTSQKYAGQVKELVIAQYHPITKELIPCGEVGVGLSAAQKRELMNDALYPFVVEVRFELRKKNNTLKHPVIVRVRDDKRPEECIFPLHMLRAA